MKADAFKFKKALKWGGMCLLAGLLTFNLERWSIRQTQQSRFENALQWSHQVASQAEGIFLEARQQGDSDPVGRVIRSLSAGSEPRVMRVTRYVPGQEKHEFQYIPEKKIFEATRLLALDESSGIRIEIDADIPRFLGVKTSLQNDLLLIVTFLLLIGFLSAVSTRLMPVSTLDRDRERERESGPDVVQLRPHLLDSNSVREWVREAKLLLSGLGGRVRDLIAEARNLATSASRSRTSVGELRNRIHAQLNRIRETRVAVKQSEQWALQSETLTLNLVIEAARLGPEAATVSRMCEEVHLLIKKIRTQNLGHETLIRQSEVDFEPLATDADVAFHAYEQIFKAAGQMDDHIRKTTETLLEHAKLIQKLNQHLKEPPPFQKDIAS